MRVPSRLIVTIAAGALAVAGGSTLADAHDGGGGGGGKHHGKSKGHDDRGRHNGSAVLGSALFGSKTTPHGGPTLFTVLPGGVDWVINGPSKAKVSRDGRVRVRIRGLVFAEGPNVGKNTLAQLAATVYCGGTSVGTTKPVPFSPEGDARIDETLATAPPSPCLVPAVLINPAPAGTAVTPPTSRRAARSQHGRGRAGRRGTLPTRRGCEAQSAGADAAQPARVDAQRDARRGAIDGRRSRRRRRDGDRGRRDHRRLGRHREHGQRRGHVEAPAAGDTSGRSRAVEGLLVPRLIRTRRSPGAAAARGPTPAS